jgi:hypothetical protein
MICTFIYEIKRKETREVELWENPLIIYVPVQCLKVPKREIFHRSDFPDFYTIKSLRVGDFGVKIKKNLINI